MIPKTLSATAIQVAQACPARFQAEMVERSKGISGFGSAATLGSSVHGALELYVKAVYLDKTAEPSLELLLQYYKLSYSKEFNSYEYETEEFAEGEAMLKKWHKETTFEGIRVISVEEKKHFMLPTSAGPIQFNYIWDRFDEIKPKVYKVVDYKSNRWNITVEDLKKKIQARVYALACAIELKAAGLEYDRIWVEFDMLRHGKVGIVFTHEENLATWEFLIATAESIIAIPTHDTDGNPVQVEERLNPECLFCVRKVSCGALAKNVMVGGIHSKSIEEAIDLRAELDWQAKGLAAVIKELDAKLLTEAKERDMEDFESDSNMLEITMSSRRAVDPEMVEMCIGPNLFNKYGSTSITMESVTKLLKGQELNDAQKAELKGLIYQRRGNPSVKVRPKNPIDH